MKALLFLLASVTIWCDGPYPHSLELSPTKQVYAFAKVQEDSLKFTVIKAYTLELVDTNWNATKDTEYIVRGAQHNVYRNITPTDRIQFVYDYISTKL
jgi:hypothetical protein